MGGITQTRLLIVIDADMFAPRRSATRISAGLDGSQPWIAALRWALEHVDAAKDYDLLVVGLLVLPACASWGHR